MQAVVRQVDDDVLHLPKVRAAHEPGDDRRQQFTFVPGERAWNEDDPRVSATFV
jgi:hypothetical protein